MDNSIFFELSAILAVTTSLAILLKLFKQPLIIAYIIAGLLIGPYFFDLLHSEEVFSGFSKFGIALLLFIIGLGLNPKVVKDVGKVSTIVGLGQILFTASLGFGITKLLGFTLVESFFIAVALTFSSTIIILKVLSDKKETSKLYARIATGVLLVQDLVASSLLVLVAGGGTEGDLSLPMLSINAGLTLLLGAVLAVISYKVLPSKPFKNFISDSQEFLFLFALAWGFGFAALFALTGLSLEVGAFFAGVALAPQAFAHEVSSRLRPLRDFFIIIFFIVLGAEIEFANISEALVPAILLSLFVLIGNPFIVMTLMGIKGYTKKTSFKLALTVAQISEFSFVFALLGFETGYISQDIVALVTLVGIITIAASTYMMLFDEKLYRLFENKLALFERRKTTMEQKANVDVDIILFGYARGGHEFVRYFKKMNKKFLVVDYDPEAIDHLEEQNINHEYGDITDIEFLDEIGVEDAKLIVSTITDFQTNLFLTTHIHELNKRAIIIPHSENPEEAARLYEHGATYVMMPHYIGSERVSQMIRRRTLRKSDFVPAREKHLRYVQSHLG